MTQALKSQRRSRFGAWPCLAVIDVTDRADIDVGLGALELFFRHISLRIDF